jgi:hydrogenase small subunit
VNGVGGCPNVGGICIACTMPGFPDKYLPMMEPGLAAKLYARSARLSNGPFARYLRERRIRRTFDVEPVWRARGSELRSGYLAPSAAAADVGTPAAAEV